jgi:molecular chaperone DnaK (HSP70)
MDADPGINAMTAIGEGAAIAAAIMSGQLNNSDFFVCLEHALGTWTTSPETGNRYFSTVIPRGHKLPAKKAEQFFPLDPEHGSVSIEVVEGDPDSKSPDWTTLKQWEVKLHEPYKPGSPRDFTLEYSYDVDGILEVLAVDNASGVTLLRDDVSYGVARDKRELKAMSDRVKAAVSTGTLSDASRVQVTDSEAAKLIEQARVKILPFLDSSETGPIEEAVTKLESAVSPSEVDSAKADLKRLVSPFSYLI